MRARLRALVSRIPWRILVAVVGGLLVVNGFARLLSVELSDDYEMAAWAAKQGMGMVVVGGVVLIGVVLSR